MKSQHTTAWLLLVGFSVLMGHLIWLRWAGPPQRPQYAIGGNVTALTAREPLPKYLYLRKRLFLPQRPRYGWIQVVSNDNARLIVNGRLINQQANEGFPTGIVEDLTNSLTAGINVIAVIVERTTLTGAPAASIEGGYQVSDGNHDIGSEGDWRYSTVSERAGDWWFDKHFDDTEWRTPLASRRFIRARVDNPPGSVSTPPFSPWIRPPDFGNLSAVVRREFWLPAAAKAAWLRVKIAAGYRLAINGIIVDLAETQVALSQPVEPAQYSYEITPLLRSGRNTVSLQLSSPTGIPRLQVDMGIQDVSGNMHRLGTDGEWRSISGTPPDWQSAGGAGWRPCTVETADLGGLPWKMSRFVADTDLPLDELISRMVGEFFTMLVLGTATWFACRWARGYLAEKSPGTADRLHLVTWTLLPSTLGAAIAELVVFDPRVMTDEVHWRILILLLLAAIPLQWRLLAIYCRSRPASENRSWRMTNERMLVAAAVMLLLISGFYLRIRNIAAEPLNPDEVTDYVSTIESLKVGYPGFKVSPDLPFRPKTTSELCSIGTGLAAILFKDECWVMRFPSVCMSTATIFLLYYFGLRAFGRVAGLVAACLYTFSPYCVQMANFGRYFSQLQFFTLLTCYFFWRTIRGTGPLDRRSLWWLTGIFCAAYLSWEGVALFGPGMVLAAVIERRGHLGTLFKDNALYVSGAVVALVVVIQLGVRLLVQTQYMIYGTGTADITLKPMWQYPSFSIWYYTGATTWTRDGLYCILGAVGAALLSIRHSFRRDVRILLFLWLANAWVMSALLPIRAPRYSYHLIPLLLLLIGACCAAGLRSLMRTVRSHTTPEVWVSYARWVGLGSVATFLAFVSGGVVRLIDFKFCRVAGTYTFDQLKFPEMRTSVDYLRHHFQEGDVIFASEPHVLNHYLKGTYADFWPETRLHLQAVLGDSRTVPLHRIGGTPMISTLDQLDDAFARYRRIWYFATPGMNQKINERDASIYLRENMDPVIQDSLHVLLLRDGHRPAQRAMEAERELQRSGASFLP